LGGGLFLDLRAKARGRRTPERREQRAALALAGPSPSFAALLESPPFAFDLAAFARDRALSAERTDLLVSGLGLVILESGDSTLAMSRERWALFTSTMLDRSLSRRTSGPSGARARAAAGHVAAETGEGGVRRRFEKACGLGPGRSGRRVRQTTIARAPTHARG
jgi:hypothetical protein